MNGILRWVGAAACALVLAACGGGGGGGDSGGGGNTPAPTPQQPKAPTATIRAAAAGATTGTPVNLQTRLGSTVSLDGSGSAPSSGTILSYAWTVAARPAGSTAALTGATSARAGFVPDVVGDYVLSLRVTDSGGSADVSLNLSVGPTVPSPTLTTSVEFSGPLETRPTRAVTLGSTIALSASAAASSAGTTLAWTLVAKPAGSSVTLPAADTGVQFVPDLAGRYTVRVRATSATGSLADVVQSFDAVADAPAVAVATSVVGNVDSRTLRVALGNAVSLSASWGYYVSSYTASWTMESQPAGSSVPSLVTSNGNTTSFVPDVPGTYNAVVTVRDSATGLTMVTKVAVIANWGPTAVVSGSSAPAVAVNGPSYVSSVGAPVTLRGTGSNDPNGGTLSYQWRIVTAPGGNTAVLATPTAANTSFTPNVNGSYLLELLVSNADGYTASQQVTVYVGNYPPVAAVDLTEITALVGKAVGASAATSYSRSGQPLTFSWALDARPAGSAATIASPGQAALVFTPDVAGSYTASVTVSDGSFSAVATVAVTALAPSAGTVPLTYRPLLSRYSSGQGKVVIVSANPNELHLVDPAAGTDTAVALPTTVKALSLSPDGRYAATLHSGTVSLIDLSTGQLLRSMLTGALHNDVAVSNTGLLYLVGGDSYSSSSTVVVLNGLTGGRLQDYVNGYYAYSGTVRVVYLASLNKIVYMQESYSTIYSSTVDPSTGLLTSTTSVSNSGYSSSSITSLSWLSSDERLLFSSNGAYFGTGDLRWVNSLGLTPLSLSHSVAGDEALALTATTDYLGSTRYTSAAQRFAGSLLFPSGTVTLPKVGGSQSYGIAVFHAADNQRVYIVQTGSAVALAQGVSYYVLKP